MVFCGGVLSTYLNISTFHTTTQRRYLPRKAISGLPRFEKWKVPSHVPTVSSRGIPQPTLREIVLEFLFLDARLKPLIYLKSRPRVQLRILKRHFASVVFFRHFRNGLGSELSKIYSPRAKLSSDIGNFFFFLQEKPIYGTPIRTNRVAQRRVRKPARSGERSFLNTAPSVFWKSFFFALSG